MLPGEISLRCTRGYCRTTPLFGSFEHREETIKENMAKMPEMIAEYRRSVYELREKTRAKKKLSEEDEYLYATGQKDMMSKQTKKVEKKKWRKK